MTAQHARSTLARPLRFGDTDQIKAARFLESVEDLKAAIHNAGTTVRMCPACKGDGEIHFARNSHSCAVCEGFGMVDEYGDKPWIFNGYDFYVIREAVIKRKQAKG